MQISTIRTRDSFRRNTIWVFPVLVSCLIAVALTIGRPSLNEPSPVNETSGQAAAKQSAAKPADVLERDLEILRAEFPGYVLPLERVRLAELLTGAIESNDDADQPNSR